jgi:hypothetical protein
MTLALDVPFLVHRIVPRADDFGGYIDVSTRGADPVKYDFQVALSPEMSGIFFRFKMPGHICTARKGVAAELLHRSEMAKHRITHLGCGGRKVRFVHRAAEQGAGGNQNVLRVCFR